MKKITEKIYCDDCGKEILTNENIITLSLPYFSNFAGRKEELIKKDFCLNCITWRVNHSFCIIEDRTCPNCDGKGKIREAYYHNEFAESQCNNCNGTGVISTC